MSTVERAREIAILAHEGQEYHSGISYFVGHIEPVVMYVTTYDEKIVAYLHDVIEDTPWTHSMLVKEGFSPTVMSAIMRLTRNKKKHTYTEYICGVAKDPLSRRVKMADLTVNMDNIPFNSSKAHLLHKYEAAYNLLHDAELLDNAAT